VVRTDLDLPLQTAAARPRLPCSKASGAGIAGAILLGPPPSSNWSKPVLLLENRAANTANIARRTG